MRTYNEIVEYYRRNRDADIFNFEAEVLLPYLPWAHYMDFAWGKVRDHRGISASRSVVKMRCWLWLLGDDEMVKLCDDGSLYRPYGAPILKRVCEKYGFPVPDSEMVRRMVDGLPCSNECMDCYA